ncbi:hypothetical protein GCM10025868_03270 [Angustibacter aerolatus]|uniref:ABC transporter domain-containing protein n=1 Tax=Angustibacter aerolatus TaxID=1162965 RepID=A0ABQ6JA65_9ACTN|nr:hypothetical protein [Angustibacter aerolatus]GMA85077.1 hypothetical protein GCM10025868_03270 [Angustibacter aerolatus]
MDPASGRVLIDGVDVRQVPFETLRRRVVMVPQDGFLFDTSLLDNTRFARPGASVDDVVLAYTEPGAGRLARGAAARPRHRRGAARRAAVGR